MSNVRIATLGPAGSNSELAARTWAARRGFGEPIITLHGTFEDAAEEVMAGRAVYLLVCPAYLQFGAIYFERVDRGIRFVDSFLCRLHLMVIATRPATQISARTIAVQPAIWPLIRDSMDLEHVPAGSNSSAADDVVAGRADACVTTSIAAAAKGLQVVLELPPLEMTFAVLERGHPQPEFQASLLNLARHFRDGAMHE